MTRLLDGSASQDFQRKLTNFRLIAKDIDVAPYLDEIASVENAFELNLGRKQKIAVQREADAIPIRGLRKSKIAGRKPYDVHESRWTHTSERFPKIRELLCRLSEELGGELSRAKVVRLPAGARVYPHIDRGEYYRIRDRYHLVFQTAPGNLLRCDDEEVHMKRGELWWFDNKKMHSAINASERERVHFIFDLLAR